MVSVDKSIGAQENHSQATKEEREDERDTPFVDDIVGNSNLKGKVKVLGDELGGGVECLHDDGIDGRSHGLCSLRE